MRLSSARSDTAVTPESFSILYRDADILVAVKRAGVPSQPDKTGADDFLSQITRDLIASGYPPERPPFLVGRLDRPVGGILLVGLSNRSAKVLTCGYMRDNAEKGYTAVVSGVPNPENGRLTDYLARNGSLNYSRPVPEGQIGAKFSELSYRTVRTVTLAATKETVSVLLVRLVTGRHHQIRVQLANAGIPIRGDTKYNPACRGRTGGGKTALFASDLTIRHPATGKTLTFHADPPFLADLV